MSSFDESRTRRVAPKWRAYLNADAKATAGRTTSIFSASTRCASNSEEASTTALPEAAPTKSPNVLLRTPPRKPVPVPSQRRASQPDILMRSAPPPRSFMSSSQVLLQARHQLSEAELLEIGQSAQIFYWGQRAKRKIFRGRWQGMPPGYDDERGNYNVCLRDHLAYRYEVIELLGKGSFGQVVKALDHKTGETVAVKIIRNKPKFHRQAQEELRILGLLQQPDGALENTAFDHPLIVRSQGHFSFRGHVCISFELLGGSLIDLLKANEYRGLDRALVRNFALQLVQSMVVFRRKKIVHCDLKPENILLRDNNSSALSVIDFGSSCLEGAGAMTYIQSRFYRSPEVLLGLPYDGPIDVWSFGCLVAELAAGLPLFPGENELEQLRCVIAVLGLPPRQMLEKCSRYSAFFDTRSGALKPARTFSRTPQTNSLQEAVGANDPLLLHFLRCCLRWDPETRSTPEELVNHPWFLAEGSRLPTKSSRFRTSMNQLT